jgi:hypothetical protein
LTQTDSLIISVRDYEAAQKKLKEYKELKREHTSLKTEHSDLKFKYDKLKENFEYVSGLVADKDISELEKAIESCNYELNRARIENEACSKYSEEAKRTIIGLRTQIIKLRKKKKNKYKGRFHEWPLVPINKH